MPCAVASGSTRGVSSNKEIRKTTELCLRRQDFSSRPIPLPYGCKTLDPLRIEMVLETSKRHRDTNAEAGVRVILIDCGTRRVKVCAQTQWVHRCLRATGL